MPTPKLTKEIVAAAILGFEEQKRGLDAQIAELRVFLSGEPAESTTTPISTDRPRRKISAAGRKAMADAQRKRWAAKKGNPEPQATPTATPTSKAAPKPKRKLSAAGRAAIIAATKRMWAAKRAAAKK
jgi:hypothetical protein